ncbi:MAG TPA: lytic transglycosylase domain-containing protein [Candidatus Polarisedimenticolia bacterium]|nr:lytic transglycosylase domain-containing protein [Candidatus Polarisedimenticolia bacterium]
MRFFAQTLFAIAVLVFGFMLGIRYERRVGSLNEIHTLVQVQKNKISEMRQDNVRLRTMVLLREFLDRARLRLPRSTVDDIASSIYQASNRYDVPPEMILAVIQTESAFDVNALSDKGAIGLMQIMPSTAQEIAQELGKHWTGDSLLRDPSANIEMGTYYLTKLIAQFDNLAVALAAYNHGPGRINQLADAKENLPMGYTQKVLSNLTYAP